MRFAPTALLATMLPLISTSTVAQQNWWFDVEVLIFDRGQAITEQNETFDYDENLAPASADWDMLGDYLRPDISMLRQNLPVCDRPSSPLYVTTPSVEQIISDFEQWQQAQPGYIEEPYTPPALPGYERSDRDGRTTDYQNTSSGFNLTSTGPSPAQIAGEWLAFHGPQTVQLELDVPSIRFCEKDAPWITYTDQQWRVNNPDNSLPYPDEVPIEPDGDSQFTGAPQLLPSSARELTKLSAQVRSARGLTRLLHTTWRQPVAFGKNKAASVHLFAGQNYATQFDIFGQPKQNDFVSIDFSNRRAFSSTGQSPSATTGQSHSATGQSLADTQASQDFFSELNQRLSDPQPVPFAAMMAAATDDSQDLQKQVAASSADANAPIWQLDGYMKVYLKYINRVPYLHIDSKLHYRQPIPMNMADIAAGAQPEYQLVSVPFHQMRRVISKQLHYFDHPLFGVVVKIRRHEM